jgi:hypothetical protein
VAFVIPTEGRNLLWLLSFRPKGGICSCFCHSDRREEPAVAFCHSDRREESAVRLQPQKTGVRMRKHPNSGNSKPETLFYSFSKNSHPEHEM